MVLYFPFKSPYMHIGCVESGSRFCISLHQVITISDNRSNWSSSLSLTLASAPWGPGRGSGQSRIRVYFLLSQRNWEVMAPQKMGKVLH